MVDLSILRQNVAGTGSADSGIILTQRDWARRLQRQALAFTSTFTLDMNILLKKTTLEAVTYFYTSHTAKNLNLSPPE
jgi:hypothetical protein